MTVISHVCSAAHRPPVQSYDHSLLGLPHTLPTPEPPPWLRARVMAAIFEEQRKRVRRATRRRRFALLLALQVLAFALHERTNA